MGQPNLKSRLRRNLLLILTILGVVVGVLGGGLLRYLQPSPDVVKYIGFPGELFMNMLKAMILPLIVASLISGLSQLDGRTSGKLGRRALIYYVLTTTHAVLLGIIVVLLLHPGDPRIKGDGNTMDGTISGKITATDKFLDLFRNMLPENIVRSTFQQQQTVYVSLNITSGRNIESARLVYADGMNVLALYEATASIFIAQINGMDLSFGQVLTVSVTATLASIGAASIPSAGLVTMMIVLTALGLPVNDISLIVAIDWFLDRLRTSVNVVGDAFGCGFVYHLSKNDLDDLPKNDDAKTEISADKAPNIGDHFLEFDDDEKNNNGNVSTGVVNV
ncbi:transporter, dicarboxylate/amino acid:cation Na+/H+ symporter family protein [Ancylostoma caninum]|uniref:Amino acid transporter n=1 Tax=Ancylostoma caninum TaxID=29170 RepID=A0A368FGX7_ANCCA|nr:transporter, dicarboxylate/amino acid:cation Na+/H+ symporter family protein [Ancylostoma caninum]